MECRRCFAGAGRDVLSRTDFSETPLARGIRADRYLLDIHNRAEWHCGEWIQQRPDTQENGFGRGLQHDVPDQSGHKHRIIPSSFRHSSICGGFLS